MSRRILITGVSSGIGWALAKLFVQEQEEVYGLSRRPPESDTVHFRAIDLSRTEGLAEQLKAWLAAVPKLDLVVLNAATLGPLGDLTQTSVTEMRRVMEINLWANKILLDELYELGMAIDQVVAISSGAAVQAARGFNAYSISKAALNMMVALYAEERPDTHFSAMAPGIVDTAMQTAIRENPESKNYPAMEFLRQAHEVGLMPSPDEVAPRLAEGFEKAKTCSSGSFLSLDELVGVR